MNKEEYNEDEIDRDTKSVSYTAIFLVVVFSILICGLLFGVGFLINKIFFLIMGRKKNVDEDGKPSKAVTYEEVKSDYVLPVSRKEYMEFLEIYHFIRPYLDRELQTTKEELLKKFPKKKAMVEDIWICVHDLKLKWTNEMVNRIFHL